MTSVTGYHAHVYFDAHTIEKAHRICAACSETLGVTMGRVHERRVGPHPDWSCQLAFAPDKLGSVVEWLSLNRDGLVVLIHPETGDALKDHTEHAVWMGAVRPLDLGVFTKPS